MLVYEKYNVIILLLQINFFTYIFVIQIFEIILYIQHSKIIYIYYLCVLSI